MYWTDIPSDGTYPITPPKRLGQGVSSFLSSQITSSASGMVVIDGAGTVTIGYFTDPDLQTFKAFTDGALSTDDVLVNHGQGVRLAAQVTGAAGLRIGYAGQSK